MTVTVPAILRSFEMVIVLKESASHLAVQFETEEEAHAAVDGIRSARPWEMCVVRGMTNTVYFPRDSLAGLSITDVARAQEQQRLASIVNSVRGHEANEETRRQISNLTGSTGFGIGADR